MKKTLLIIINAIGCVFLAAIIYWLAIGAPLVSALVFWAIWVAYELVLNYIVLKGTSSSELDVEGADRYHLFPWAVAAFESSLASLKHYERVFADYSDNETVTEAFSLAQAQIYHNVKVARRWLLQYDRNKTENSKVDSPLLHTLVDRTQTIVKQLSELSELLLLMESADDVDYKHIEEIISSLKEVMTDDQEF